MLQTVSLNATRTGVGQAFTPGLSSFIRSARFYLSKDGSPTGTIVSKLYATTGPAGSAAPTGSALATSAGLDVSTFTSYAHTGAGDVRLFSQPLLDVGRHNVCDRHGIYGRQFDKHYSHC